MSDHANTVTRAIAPAVTAMGYELLGCLYLQQGRHSLVRIYIDSEKGIDVDDCQEVSRQVSAILDVEDPIRGQYTLEVSSPGLDRPLFTEEHYRRFLGHNVRVRTRIMIEGRRNFSGALQEVTDDKVLIQMEDKAYSLPLASIERANLIPDFTESFKRK